jgi:hypothetical protein
MMEGWINPDPYVNKTEEVVCRDCNKTFQINTSYDKNGVPVSFRAKYCTDCNLKMKKPDITVTGAIGTNIVSASIPQKNVEGLEERFEKTEKALHSTINLTFEHGQKIDELNKQNVNRFAEIKDLEHNIEEKEFEFDIFKNVTEQVIKNNKLDLDVFKSAQNNFNEDQIGINLAHFTLIKEIHKTLIIGFWVFIVFSLATWGYLLYTLLKH